MLSLRTARWYRRISLGAELRQRERLSRNHFLDHGLDVSLLIFSDAVFLVELSVGPGTIPFLLRQPRVRFLGGVLTDLPERNEKPSKPSPNVGSCAFALRFRVKGPDAKVSKRTN